MRLVVGFDMDVSDFVVAIKLAAPRQNLRDYLTGKPFRDPTHQYFDDLMAARFALRSLSNCTA